VVEGSLKLAAALGEKQSRYELHNIKTTAKADGAGYVLDGAKSVVLHGAQADKLVVSARTAGAQRDTAGITLFLVDRSAAGVSMTDYPTIDSMRAGELTLKGVKVGADAVIGKVGEGHALIELVTDHALVALCAEAVGAMVTANEHTLEYLKTRQQFGVPIGKFQALQHRAVEMFMEAEQAKSLTYLAAVKVDSPDRTERRRAVSAAKARVGKSLKFVGQSAIQLHGGMGMTEELAISHYFKRLTLIDQTLGDVDHHVGLFAALG
jgi:alkylation response protein AidB-like acyl-CoA dehydrogenase